MRTADLLGIVAIGRNEGERLKACLQSALQQTQRVVYVDSGSTDGSADWARSQGIAVVDLDLSLPFTAARARNAGLAHLLDLFPDLAYVQFVDGDCELVPNWCDRAGSVLATNPTLAVVCGQRQEKFPQTSVFNRLCEWEWNTPIGEALACGGDALMRVEALQAVGGYRSTLIAGEEPELCLRLRQAGWRVLRIDQAMTWHDARMMQFSQWWRRTMRGGYAYGEVSWIHRRDTEPFWQRESRRIWVWGLGLPTLVLILMPFTHGWSGWLGLAYPMLMLKTYGQSRDRLGGCGALTYAFFCTLAKFPELQGQLGFHLNRLRGDRSTLIEYK